MIPNSSSASLTVYFDGACPVCSREIAHYRRQPGAQACRWVDAASCAPSELGADLTRDNALGRFHVRGADDRLVDGMRGFAALWRALPRTAWLGRVASFGPMTVLFEGAYRLFLAVRPLWRKPPVRVTESAQGLERRVRLDAALADNPPVAVRHAAELLHRSR